ncbi:MAG: hypothetical protein H6738_05290 [Alphaproteobacteria bacterium]|nr:hypothetical protein [Alphaproteobacteria bacterium]MCB9696181.1 hypothetical protein [Alphaproteobacteria bacterium]
MGCRGFVAIVAVGALGCDDTLGNGLVGDVGRDSGLTSDSGFESTTKISDATQVGSEGFWGCPIEKLDPLEPSAQPVGFDEGVGVAVQGHLGSWPLTVIDAATAGEVVGTLELTAGEVWRWVDVADGTGCEDHVLASVTATLTRDAGPAMPLSGMVVVRPDGQGGVVLTGDRAAAEPAWGTGTSGGALFRLEGALGVSEVAATVAYADCASTEPHCEAVTPIASVNGTR